MNPLWIGMALQACAPDSSGEETGEDSAATDSGESGDTAATLDTDTAPPDTDGTTGRPRDSMTVNLASSAIAKFIFPQFSEAGSTTRLNGAGDCTGDGIDDLIFGVPVHSDIEYGGGIAYLVPGPTAGTTVLDTVEVIGTGGNLANYGAAVAGVGDIDADGFYDFMVSASTQYVDEDQQAGEVYLYSGPFVSNGDAPTVPTATLKGEWQFSEYANSSYTGDSLAGLGDYNGDGFGDVVIGAPGYVFPKGAAYVMLGPLTGDHYIASEATLRVTNVGATNVASAGDVNGDGLGDVILGAGSETTYAWIFLGPSAGDVEATDADASIVSSSDLYGGSQPVGVGDVDGDGYDDVVVDSPADDEGGENAGTAWLLRGPHSGTRSTEEADAKLYGTVPSLRAGASLAPAGDTNADGFADILIGAPQVSVDPDAAGVSYLVLGPVSGHLPLDQADVILEGEGGDDQSGYSVAGAGDVDGDGMDDLLIGGPGDDDGGTNAGAAWLVTAATLWAK